MRRSPRKRGTRDQQLITYLRRERHQGCARAAVLLVLRVAHHDAAHKESKHTKARNLKPLRTVGGKPATMTIIQSRKDGFLEKIHHFIRVLNSKKLQLIFQIHHRRIDGRAYDAS